jgi:hypothetical protein
LAKLRVAASQKLIRFSNGLLFCPTMQEQYGYAEGDEGKATSRLGEHLKSSAFSVTCYERQPHVA